MDNKKISEVFEEMGNILDISGADFFRINAYRRGAMIVMNMHQDLRKMVDDCPNDISKISGIGKALQEKIIELVLTGHCAEHEKMKKGFPAGLLEILSLRGLGPKKVKLFYSKLGIKTVKDLKKAAEQHKLQELERMGAKSESEILKAIDEHARFDSDRSLISEALQEAERIIEYMKKSKGVKRIEYAGSLRRAQDNIGDVDILVTVKDPEKSREAVIDHFVSYDEVLTVIAKGDTKSSLILESGIQVDLRVIADESFGAAMHYFTGSKSHNIAIRDIAKKKGLKVSEYGVFKGEKMIAGKTEEDLFKAIGLPYIIPELRQNNGEIEYALKHKKFPKFVEMADIKGDLHCHSNYSDGKNTIEEMANAFISMGYEYFAITDHSSLVGIVNGMGSKEIKKQWKEVDSLNKKLKGKIKIFKGCEVDILKDGSLDFSDDILKELDVVIISAHMYARLDDKDQTARLIAAIENPYSTIMGHPTGRLINKRPEMNFNMEKIIDACVENGVALEINSSPSRLDLVDKYLKIAKDKGVKFAIGTDSHSVDQVDFMSFGVGIARRGWLESNNILNTKSLSKFDKDF